MFMEYLQITVFMLKDNEHEGGGAGLSLGFSLEKFKTPYHTKSV